MLGIDPKAARYTWTAAAVLLLMWLVYLVRSTLFVFILAVLFAYLLSPLVNLLDRFLPTRTRTPALAQAVSHSPRPRQARGPAAGYLARPVLPRASATASQPTPRCLAAVLRLG